MSCGIYKIVSELFKERIYIGSASDIQKRWNRQMRQNNLGKILSEETKNKMRLTRQGRKFKKLI